MRLFLFFETSHLSNIIIIPIITIKKSLTKFNKFAKAIDW